MESHSAKAETNRQCYQAQLMTGFGTRTGQERVRPRQTLGSKLSIHNRLDCCRKYEHGNVVDRWPFTAGFPSSCNRAGPSQLLQAAYCGWLTWQLVSASPEGHQGHGIMD